jgi:putative DNA modification/repair radical SAM protein
MVLTIEHMFVILFLVMNMDIKNKLEILSDAAKYDVSCSSSGSSRSGESGSLGSAANSGICHSFTPDGRCISLLKILLTNYCIYDCAYCINRRSNDVRRAAFTVDEVVDLTINFYRRNYIEGLFLSSAVVKDANHTMEMLTEVLKKLRTEKRFRGYIHVKAIPGASEDLISECGLYADRMSVNVELPSSASLKLLAPEKTATNIYKPMSQIATRIAENQEDRRYFINTPTFVPGGQSTQLIVGASPDNDLTILKLSEQLYNNYDLKRVYYSAYVPINTDKNLPTIQSPPTLREHRLYQSDWLVRVYNFKVNELLTEQQPNLDVNFDPKTCWALRNLNQFPVEVNSAPYDMLIRIPGIGLKGARKIMSARRLSNLTFDDLKKLRIAVKRAQFFVLCSGKHYSPVKFDVSSIAAALLPEIQASESSLLYKQISLFDTPSFSPSPFDQLLLSSDVHTSITGEL